MKGGWSIGLIGWILLGAIAGSVAAHLMHEEQGCLTHIIVGIIGALLGGFIFSLATDTRMIIGFNLWSLFVAVIGSIVFLALLRLVRGKR